MPQVWPRTKFYKQKSTSTFLKSNISGEGLKKKKGQGVPVVASWLTNATRNHEVAELIPGLAQRVKDPALPRAVV